MEKRNNIHGREFAKIPNPTNAVGGLFIFGLQEPGGPFNVSPNPTTALVGFGETWRIRLVIVGQV
jgi:hypothetical protein